MKIIQLLPFLFILDVFVVDSKPQYGTPVRPNQPQNEPQCKTEYESVTEVVYDKFEEEVCEPVMRRKCDRIVPQQQCQPQQQEICRNVNKQKCESGTKKECREIWREEQRPYTDQECWNQPITLCEQVWVNSGYGGEEDWVDDPSTCQTQNQKKCRKVTKYRTEKIRDQQCIDVPWQKCRNVPEKKCDWITKQVCQTVQMNECYNVQEEECRQEHRRKPRIETKKIPKHSCQNRQGEWIEVGPRDNPNSTTFPPRTAGSDSGGGGTIQNSNSGGKIQNSGRRNVDPGLVVGQRPLEEVTTRNPDAIFFGE